MPTSWFHHVSIQGIYVYILCKVNHILGIVVLDGSTRESPKHSHMYRGTHVYCIILRMNKKNENLNSGNL